MVITHPLQQNSRLELLRTYRVREGITGATLTNSLHEERDLYQ